MGDNDGKDVENSSGYEKSWVRLPDQFGRTSYWCNYTADWDSYLPYKGWYIDSHTKFS